MSSRLLVRSTRIPRPWLLALAAMLWLPTSVAAENPNFAGEWVLVPEKSKNLGALTGAKQTLKLDGDQFTIARTVEFVEQEKPLEYEYVYTVDGEQHMVKDPTGLAGEAGERETTAGWKGWGGKRLEAKWNLIFSGITVKVTETWESKGKDLQIERKFENPVGETKHKHYYVRAKPAEDDS